MGLSEAAQAKERERRRLRIKGARLDLPRVSADPDPKIAARIDAALKDGVDPRDVERRFRGLASAAYVRQRAKLFSDRRCRV